MAGGNLRYNDAAWKALRRRLQDVDGKELRVGVLASKGGGATVPGTDITLVELAAIHEFGSPAANIPERSFIRLTLAGGEKMIADVVAKIARGIVNAKVTVQRGLDILGAFISTEIKKTITDGPSIPPPLQPETERRKGSTRALVDTGRLVDSVTWEVTDKGGD